VNSRIRQIVRRLETVHGPRPWRIERSADGGLDGLIATILSQHTSDANSDAAYMDLRRAFRTWRACMNAPAGRVERAIRWGGLARQKARSIQAVLRRLDAERGELSLAFLRRWPLARAREYLRGLPGVGPKTAACVLLFYLGKPALPVDTHVHRLARRLGLIPADASADEAHEILEPACPPRLVYPFHVLLITHGRKVCQARQPRCDECVLADICPSAFSAAHRREEGVRSLPLRASGSKPELRRRTMARSRRHRGS
jgi:endonuclease-3